MKSLLAVVALAAVVACGGRQVEVNTTPAPSSDMAVHVTNNLSQAVNVYVNSGGSDIFLKQVSAGSSEHVPVPGIAAGTTVTIKATTIDNSKTYTKENVSLAGMYMWQVP